MGNDGPLIPGEIFTGNVLGNPGNPSVDHIILYHKGPSWLPITDAKIVE